MLGDVNEENTRAIKGIKTKMPPTFATDHQKNTSPNITPHHATQLCWNKDMHNCEPSLGNLDTNAYCRYIVCIKIIKI